LKQLLWKLQGALKQALTAAGSNKALRALRETAAVSPAFYLVLLAVLSAGAGADVVLRGETRRVFRFYTLDTGALTVEERLLPRLTNREEAVSQYVREFILGPMPETAAALFNPCVSLQSLIVKGSEAYVSLSAEAVLPVEGAFPLEKGAFRSLKEGIRVNFPALSKVKIFAGGCEVQS
jgi:hypothetical protein